MVLDVSFASLVMSFLKFSHRIWGLTESLVALLLGQLFRSAMSVIPLCSIFCMRGSLFRRCSGQVHRPLPMNGASCGAYFTLTNQWSVGTDEGFIDQSKTCRAIFWVVYIQSRHEYI